MKRIFYRILFLNLICISLSDAAFGQEFLNRSYLKSLPGAGITKETENTDVDSLNKILFKQSFLDEKVKNKNANDSISRLEYQRTKKITVLYLWQIDTDLVAEHLRTENEKNGSQRNVRLTGTTDKDAAGTLYSELTNDFTGLWRISLASSITASGEETEEESESSVKDIQNFFMGGGNIIAKGSLPLLLIYNTKFRHTRNTGIYFVPKAGVSFPAFGTSSNDPTWNIDTGIETEVYAGGIKNEIGFYGRLRVAAVWASRDFTKQLLSDNRRFFGYGQANVGALLKEKLFINLNFPVSAPINIFGKEDPIDGIPVSISTGLLF